MMHTRRKFCVLPVETADELAEKPTAHIWTLCTAFRLTDYLFLNDSTSEDAAQEYAVARATTENGPALQVESITFGWCVDTRPFSHLLDPSLRTTGNSPTLRARPLRCLGCHRAIAARMDGYCSGCFRTIRVLQETLWPWNHRRA